MKQGKRILSAEIPDDQVRDMERLAQKNNRSLAGEAAVAIKAHVVASKPRKGSK